MKLLIISFISAAVVLTGCSTQRSTAQSSDDLYSSPSKQSGYAASSNSNNGEYYDANPNDQYLMMKAQDPSRWSTFDDYSYDGFYSPYSSYGYSAGYYSAFSPWITFGYWNPYYYYMSGYYMWNSFYNPYYYGVVVVNPHYPSFYNAYTGIHPFNVNAYRSGINGTAYTGKFYTPTRAGNSFNNRNSTHPFSNQSTNYQSTRTYVPSSFGGSGGGMRSSGGFGRSGKG